MKNLIKVTKNSIKQTIIGNANSQELGVTYLASIIILTIICIISRLTIGADMYIPRY